MQRNESAYVSRTGLREALKQWQFCKFFVLFAEMCYIHISTFKRSNDPKSGARWQPLNIFLFRFKICNLKPCMMFIIQR